MGNHAVQFYFIVLSVECNAVGAVKRGNADPGLADAQVEGSAVLERVVEVVRTVGAGPVYLNILAIELLLPPSVYSVPLMKAL